MLNQELYEVNNRDSLLYKGIVLMPVVMESDIFPVIGVDTGKCDDRAPQVAADIFNDGIGVGKGRFCIDIKAVLIFAVDKGFGLFEGRADSFFHFTQEGAVFQEEMHELFVDSKDADVLHFNSSGMEGILNYFIVVFKNLLQDVHEIIVQ